MIKVKASRVPPPLANQAEVGSKVIKEQLGTPSKGWTATGASKKRPPAPAPAPPPVAVAKQPQVPDSVDKAIKRGARAIGFLPDAALRGATKEQKLAMVKSLLSELRCPGSVDPDDAETERESLTQLVLGSKTAAELDYVLSRVDATDLARELSGVDRLKAQKHIETLHAPTPGDWAGYRSYLEQVANTGPATKNSLDFLVDGAEVAPKGLEVLSGAKDSINLSVFQLEGDQVGATVVDLLCQKAKAGVKVRVLLDGFGSESDKLDGFVSKLKAAGAEVIINKAPLLKDHLDHRKVLVVDGNKAFTGGMNIGEHYQREWHDQQTYVTGPAVSGLQDAFWEHWKREGGAGPEGAEKERYHRAGSAPAAGAETYVVKHEGNARDRNIKAAYLKAFNTAEKSITISNPYFADADIIQTLCNAAKRGVKVQVILPAENDMAVVKAAAVGYYPNLIKAGVEVYEYQGRMAHQKVAVVDGKWATVGSSNLDARSLEYNDEMNLVVLDEKFAASVQEKMFDKDLPQSKRITHADPTFQQRLDRLISPLI